MIGTFLLENARNITQQVVGKFQKYNLLRKIYRGINKTSFPHIHSYLHVMYLPKPSRTEVKENKIDSFPKINRIEHWLIMKNE